MMAKIPFTKLGLVKNLENKTFEWNEQVIEVKQYLPIQDKLELIAAVLNSCQDENNFVNDAKLFLFIHLEMVFKYTNISFTEKQKEDSAKLYDLLEGNGFVKRMIENIPEDEYYQTLNWCIRTAEHVYEYRNSVYGILDTVSNDYSNLELDADKLKNEMADPNSLDLLKNVLTKLG